MSLVLVSGGTGFIGSAIVRHSLGSGVRVRAMARKMPSSRIVGAEYCLIEDILSSGVQLSLFHGVDYVVHAAGMAHTVSFSSDFEAELFKVNAHGTRAFAEAAAKEGVQRFVFLSTIAVHGDCSGEAALREGSPLRPSTAYGASKLEAERALEEISHNSGMKVVIVRLPMVYGPGAPGNPRRLARLIANGIPIPVPSQRNSRSLIGIDNLTSFLIECCINPAAAGETFVVSDGVDVSTEQIIEYLAEGMGRKLRLIKLPGQLLKAVVAVVGKRALYEKVYSSLRVDSSKAFSLLGWTPPKTVRQGLVEMGRAYKASS